jgi:hypothetical protein
MFYSRKTNERAVAPGRKKQQKTSSLNVADDQSEKLPQEMIE